MQPRQRRTDQRRVERVTEPAFRDGRNSTENGPAGPQEVAGCLGSAPAGASHRAGDLGHAAPDAVLGPAVHESPEVGRCGLDLIAEPFLLGGVAEVGRALSIPTCHAVRTGLRKGEVDVI